MYLVDTSVWIDYINGTEAEHVSLLGQLLTNPLAIGLNSHWLITEAIARVK